MPLTAGQVCRVRASPAGEESDWGESEHFHKYVIVRRLFDDDIVDTEILGSPTILWYFPRFSLEPIPLDDSQREEVSHVTTGV